MDRALREFRIRGVKTNIPFLDNVIDHPTFLVGPGDDHASSTTTPELFEFTPRRDRATKLLTYLGDVIVNGNPHAKGYRPPAAAASRAGAAGVRPHGAAAATGTRQTAARARAGEVRRVDARSRSGCSITDTTFRDAHQSLLATRVRTYDMLAIADAVAHRAAEPVLARDVGRRDVRHGDALPAGGPVGAAAPSCAQRIPNILFQMLLRGVERRRLHELSRTTSSRASSSDAADAGMDIFRIFDSLNWLPNMQVGDGGGAARRDAICEAAICYTGDILDPKRAKYSLKYYVELAKELEKHGRAHPRHQGHGRPVQAATPRDKLVKALQARRSASRSTSTRTTPAASTRRRILQRRRRRRRHRRRAPSPRCPACTSQPNLNSIVAALAAHAARHRPRPRRAQRVLRLLGGGARVLRARSTPRRRPAPPTSTCTRCPAASTRTSREQAESHGPRRPLARDRPHLRRGEPAASATS